MAFIDDGQKQNGRDEEYLNILEWLELEKNADHNEVVYEFDELEDEKNIDD